MKLLSIDCRKSPATFLVANEDRNGFGTLHVLTEDEIKACAIWLARVGGRGLLDDFEVSLINAGALRIWPHDADGHAHSSDWVCIDTERSDTGIRLIWERRVTCKSCDGDGHTAALGDEVTDDDVCAYCDGDGSVYDDWTVTDMDGLVLPKTTN